MGKTFRQRKSHVYELNHKIALFSSSAADLYYSCACYKKTIQVLNGIWIGIVLLITLVYAILSFDEQHGRIPEVTDRKA